MPTRGEYDADSGGAAMVTEDLPRTRRVGHRLSLACWSSADGSLPRRPVPAAVGASEGRSVPPRTATRTCAAALQERNAHRYARPTARESAQYVAFAARPSGAHRA